MNEGAPGRFVGDRYHIVRELGRGGMGVVYLGRDLRLDMDVAIKFRGVTHSDATLWLKREFRSVASLRHPNLVELYELVAHDTSCYYTMEYLPGMDPRRWVERRAPGAPGAHDLDDAMFSEHSTRSAAPLQEANTAATDPPAAPATVTAPVVPRLVPAVDFARLRDVVVQLAEGIAYLHARGVIHRDVKPSNAIVVGGVVKLLDFGLALERHRQDDDVARESRIVGTAAYLAPEYLERLVVSPQMDVYALGVLAFELCTGQPPFGGTLHVLSRLQAGRIKIPRVAEINPEIPPDLDDVIDGMLAANPEQRPSALEVVQRLASTGSQPSSDRPAMRARREPPFVGRKRELAQIAEYVADPTPRGRLLVVIGPSGSGKTTLIDRAVGLATGIDREHDSLVWRGRCHERERLPYRAFDQIVDDLATELAGDPRLARGIDHAAALARVFPVLAPLIDPRRDEPPLADLRVERERALLALVQTFAKLVTTPHGLIVIDDLQWADDDSLELLALLVERIDVPLTVVASWTSDGSIALPPAVAALSDRLGAAAQIIDVPAMTEDDLLAMLAELAPRAPTSRLALAARLAQGSPYLAELIGRELGEADVADPEAAEQRRLDRLEPAERMVAEITALSAGAATFEQLRALAQLPSGRLQSVLRGLEDARVVRATPALAGDPVYVFYHQRLRETASAAMAGEARRAMHERFARWFEDSSSVAAGAELDAGQLAYHWQHAGAPERAAHWAIVAGDAAKSQLAWALAASWYQRAVSLTDGYDSPRLSSAPHGAPRGGRSVDNGAARSSVASSEAAAMRGSIDKPVDNGVARSSGATSRSSIDTIAVRGKLAECLFLGGKLAAAADEFLALARIEASARVVGAGTDDASAGDHSDARERVRDEPDVRADRWRVRAAEAYLKLGELARGLRELDGVLARRGEKRTEVRAMSVARAAVVAARWLSPLPTRTRAVDDVLASAYRVIASFLSTPYPLEALEYVLRGVALAEKTGDRGAYATGMATLSAYVATGTLGRFGDRAVANARRLSVECGAPYPRMVAAGAAGMLATLRGEWPAMRAAHEEAEAVCKKLGLDLSWEASFLRTYWALGELYAGEPARAEELLRALADTSDDLWTRAMLGSCRGRVLVLAGDLEAARAVALDLDRTPAARQGMAGIYRQVFLGELALAQHDWERAASVADALWGSARAQWLHVMPPVAAMIEVIDATAQIGLANDAITQHRSKVHPRRLVARAREVAQRLLRRGRSSFYAATAARLLAQAARLAGDDDRALLARARSLADDRGGKIDQLATRALAGEPIDAGTLAPAVAWSTAGMWRSKE
ncbi:MAG: serine/threonine-protein kinase PknK [Kofleriaceae bacterium]